LVHIVFISLLSSSLLSLLFVLIKIKSMWACPAGKAPAGRALRLVAAAEERRQATAFIPHAKNRHPCFCGRLEWRAILKAGKVPVLLPMMKPSIHGQAALCTSMILKNDRRIVT